MIAVSVKPCIVMCILPDAGAISTSAEFLLVILPNAGAISTSAEFLFKFIIETYIVDAHQTPANVIPMSTHSIGCYGEIIKMIY